MLKRDLLKKIESLPDDAYIVFAQFCHSEIRGYHWRLLNQTIQRPGDPANVIGLSSSSSGIFTETLQEMGHIGIRFNNIQEGGTL